MLKRLLSLIATNDGVSSLDELAQEMGVPRPLVEQLMAELVRRGYLDTAKEERLPPGCAACALRPGCQPTLGIGVWELTEKGAACLPQRRTAARANRKWHTDAAFQAGSRGERPRASDGGCGSARGSLLGLSRTVLKSRRSASHPSHNTLQ